MEYSKTLTSVAKLLIESQAGSFEIYESYNPAVNIFTVVAELTYQSRAYKGTASGVNRAQTLFRACIEAGETQIAKSQGWTSRTGLAGGFVAGNAVERGKIELIEREAFYHHYRTMEPFTEIMHEGFTSIRLFQLNSADPRVIVMLAAPIVQTHGCLKFGLGASKDVKQSIQKAAFELHVIQLDHEMRAEYCDKVFNKEIEPANLADFHHAQSRDPRNLEIFNKLTTAPGTFNKRTLHIAYKTQKMSTPLRLVKYVRVTAENLQLPEFGVPESQAANLFHPLW